MALMKTNCDYCQKKLIQVSEFKMDNIKYVTYTCGHTLTYKIDPKVIELSLENVAKNKFARHYQVDGVDFIVNGADGNEGGFNCILGDQMRIGKTPQFLMAVATRMRIDPDFKVLIILRATNMRQWLREFKDWVTQLPLGVYMIEGSKNFIPPGFSCYIISMDTFANEGTCKHCKHGMNRHDPDAGDRCTHGKRTNQCPCKFPESAGDAMSDVLLKFGFKAVGVDEAHAFKNTGSKRAQALQRFLKTINKSEQSVELKFNCPMCKHEWTTTANVSTESGEEYQRVSKTMTCTNCQAKVNQQAVAKVKVIRNCGVVFLTGTAIKNRADELFIPLNIVAPAKFPNIDRFRRDWLLQDDKGKWSRVNPVRYDSFKKTIAPFYLRREKEDVYQDLPKMNRMFSVITIEDERLKKAYNDVLDRMEKKMAEKANWSYFDNIGELMILRRICGMAKTKFAADYVEMMCYDSDKTKVAVGVHHHSVRDTLKIDLKPYGVVTLDGTDSPEEKDRLAHKYFEHSPERVMILGMMAAKEGLELLYIPKALVLEREFTAADEEQFEFRFYNQDQELLAKRGYPNKVTEVEYIVAKGTIDEFFYDIVEEKRAIFGETLGTNWSIAQDGGSFKQLIERTVSQRL